MLKLKEAKALSEAVLTHGEPLKTNPLTVVVLDKGGHVLCVMRDENSGIMRYEVAYGKAWGALGMGFGTRTFAQMAESSDKFQSFVKALGASQGRVIPTQGGVLVRNQGGELLGALGVSGDSSERDEACILYAVQQMNWIPQP
ncbi:MAG: heme-binding protein [Cyclobacteriaceae bacterium]